MTAQSQTLPDNLLAEYQPEGTARDAPRLRHRSSADWIYAFELYSNVTEYDFSVPRLQAIPGRVAEEYLLEHEGHQYLLIRIERDNKAGSALRHFLLNEYISHTVVSRITTELSRSGLGCRVLSPMEIQQLLQSFNTGK